MSALRRAAAATLATLLAASGCAPTPARAVAPAPAAPTAAVAVAVAVADDEPAAPFARERLAPDLLLLTSPDGNLLLAHDARGALLVDAAVAADAAALLAVLDELAPGPRRLAVNTHWHSDHTGGNPGLAAAGVTLLAHEAVRARRAVLQPMPALGREIPALPPGGLPVITYARGLVLHGAGGRVELVHLPAAHTDGDTLVHFVERDVLHTGDLFEGDDYPFLDVHAGGSLDGLIAALDAALARCGPDTRVIPGHGPPSTPDDLRRTRDMLAQARARLAPLVEQGLGVEAILERDPLADFPAHWGDGFISRRGFTITAAQSLLLAREAAAATDDAAAPPDDDAAR